MHQNYNKDSGPHSTHSINHDFHDRKKNTLYMVIDNYNFSKYYLVTLKYINPGEFWPPQQRLFSHYP